MKLLFAMTLTACTYETTTFVSLPVEVSDASQPSHIDAALPVPAVDAGHDVAVLVEPDSGVSAEDAGIDVAASVDAGPPNGNACSTNAGTRQCVTGFEYRVTGESTDYPCGLSPYPNQCPHGWPCWWVVSGVAHSGVCK